MSQVRRNTCQSHCQNIYQSSNNQDRSFWNSDEVYSDDRALEIARKTIPCLNIMVRFLKQFPKQLVINLITEVAKPENVHFKSLCTSQKVEEKEFREKREFTTLSLKENGASVLVPCNIRKQLEEVFGELKEDWTEETTTVTPGPLHESKKIQLPWEANPDQLEHETQNESPIELAAHSNTDQIAHTDVLCDHKAPAVDCKNFNEIKYLDPGEVIAIENCSDNFEFVDVESIECEGDKVKICPTSESEMYAGRISRSELGLWVCNICSKNYKSLKIMKKHVGMHFSKCENHCSECQLSFENSEDLDHHKISHVTSSLVLGHICKYCYKSYRLKHLLEKHVAGEHSDSSERKTSSYEFRETCGKCVRVFYSSVEMEDHDESCTEGIMETEEKSSEEDEHESTLLQRQKQSKRYSCYLCDLIFDTSVQLSFHFKKIHGGDKPLQCEICEKYFSTLKKLIAHKFKSHNKSFECDICKKKFGEKARFADHLRTHSGEKPFTCSQCGKAFASKYAFNRHVRSHSVVYKCDVCPKVFNFIHYLNYHKAIHDSVPAFVCEHCGRGIFVRGTYSWHKRSKSCSQCGLQFLCNGGLQEHRLKFHSR